MDWNLPLLLQGSYNSVITYILLGLFISKWYQNYQGNKFLKLTVGTEAIFQKSLADSLGVSG